MNISGLGNSVMPAASVLGTSGVNPAASGDSQGDGGRVHHGHHGHHGGGMRQAVLQALQSLGVSATSSSGAASSSDPDGDGDAAPAGTAATGGLKHDLRQFMQALFQAVRSEASPGAASTDATATSAAPATGGPRADFTSGLSALISQVSAGSAPSDLQSAFDKLASDLQPSSAAGSADAGVSSATSLTLQKLLETLQQGLGYGASTASTASVGNIVSQSA
jgi:hypothetical protein